MKITKEMIDEWVELYKSGKENCSSIARQYNVSRSWVYQTLRKHGVEISGRKKKMLNNITMKMIKEWISEKEENNSNCREIADKYGVSEPIVYKTLTSMGYKFSRNTHHSQIYNELICLYDEYDQLAYCFDSVYEMSKKTGKSYSTIQSNISRYRKKIRSGKIRINNKIYQIRLIEKENEDI